MKYKEGDILRAKDKINCFIVIRENFEEQWLYIYRVLDLQDKNAYNYTMEFVEENFKKVSLEEELKINNYFNL